MTKNDENPSPEKRKSRHGGPREGAGAPAQLQDGRRINIYVSASQHAKIKARGGSAWLRSLIDEAE